MATISKYGILRHLRAEPNQFVLHFSNGKLARSGADIKAVVGFHSGLRTVSPAAAGAIKAKILVCIGADDPFIPAEQQSDFAAEMRAAGADWQMHLYGGTVHSFTNKEAARRNMPEAIRYSPDADARSWASMQQLFAETLAARS